MTTAIQARLSAKLAPCSEPGCGCDCLLWPCNTGRYGQIWVDGHNRLVHRVAWEAENGAIPDGLTIDHVKARGCVHLNCAKVAHLEPVTHRVNVLRSTGLTAVNAAKEHCPRKHLYDQANTYVYPDGRRACRKCHRASNREVSRRAYARKKAAA